MKTKNFLKKHIQQFIRDESGQGTTEYILMLVGVVAIALAFKGEIIPKIKQKIGDLGGHIMDFRPE